MKPRNPKAPSLKDIFKQLSEEIEDFEKAANEIASLYEILKDSTPAEKLELNNKLSELIKVFLKANKIKQDLRPFAEKIKNLDKEKPNLNVLALEAKLNEILAKFKGVQEAGYINPPTNYIDEATKILQDSKLTIQSDESTSPITSIKPMRSATTIPIQIRSEIKKKSKKEKNEHAMKRNKIKNLMKKESNFIRYTNEIEEIIKQARERQLHYSKEFPNNKKENYLLITHILNLNTSLDLLKRNKKILNQIDHMNFKNVEFYIKELNGYVIELMNAMPAESKDKASEAKPHEIEISAPSTTRGRNIAQPSAAAAKAAVQNILKTQIDAQFKGDEKTKYEVIHLSEKAAEVKAEFTQLLTDHKLTQPEFSKLLNTILTLPYSSDMAKATAKMLGNLLSILSNHKFVTLLENADDLNKKLLAVQNDMPLTLFNQIRSLINDADPKHKYMELKETRDKIQQLLTKANHKTLDQIYHAVAIISANESNQEALKEQYKQEYDEDPNGIISKMNGISKDDIARISKFGNRYSIKLTDEDYTNYAKDISEFSALKTIIEQQLNANWGKLMATYITSKQKEQEEKRKMTIGSQSPDTKSTDKTPNVAISKGQATNNEAKIIPNDINFANQNNFIILKHAILPWLPSNKSASSPKENSINTAREAINKLGYSTREEPKIIESLENIISGIVSKNGKRKQIIQELINKADFTKSVKASDEYAIYKFCRNLQSAISGPDSWDSILTPLTQSIPELSIQKMPQKGTIKVGDQMINVEQLAGIPGGDAQVYRADVPNGNKTIPTIIRINLLENTRDRKISRELSSSAKKCLTQPYITGISYSSREPNPKARRQYGLEVSEFCQKSDLLKHVNKLKTETIEEKKEKQKTILKYSEEIRSIIKTLNEDNIYFPDIKPGNFLINKDDKLVISDIKTLISLVNGQDPLNFSNKNGALNTTDSNRPPLGNDVNLIELQNNLIGISIYQLATGELPAKDPTTGMYIFDFEKHKESFSGDIGKKLQDQIQLLTTISPKAAAPTSTKDAIDILTDDLLAENAKEKQITSLPPSVRKITLERTLSRRLSIFGLNTFDINNAVPVDKAVTEYYTGPEGVEIINKPEQRITTICKVLAQEGLKRRATLSSEVRPVINALISHFGREKIESKSESEIVAKFTDEMLEDALKAVSQPPTFVDDLLDLHDFLAVESNRIIQKINRKAPIDEFDISILNNFIESLQSNLPPLNDKEIEQSEVPILVTAYKILNIAQNSPINPPDMAAMATIEKELKESLVASELFIISLPSRIERSTAEANVRAEKQKIPPVQPTTKRGKITAGSHRPNLSPNIEPKEIIDHTQIRPSLSEDFETPTAAIQPYLFKQLIDPPDKAPQPVAAAPIMQDDAMEAPRTNDEAGKQPAPPENESSSEAASDENEKNLPPELDALADEPADELIKEQKLALSELKAQALRLLDAIEKDKDGFLIGNEAALLSGIVSKINTSTEEMNKDLIKVAREMLVLAPAAAKQEDIERFKGLLSYNDIDSTRNPISPEHDHGAKPIPSLEDMISLADDLDKESKIEPKQHNVTKPVIPSHTITKEDAHNLSKAIESIYQVALDSLNTFEKDDFGNLFSQIAENMKKTLSNLPQINGAKVSEDNIPILKTANKILDHANHNTEEFNNEKIKKELEDTKRASDDYCKKLQSFEGTRTEQNAVEDKIETLSLKNSRMINTDGARISPTVPPEGKMPDGTSDNGFIFEISAEELEKAEKNTNIMSEDDQKTGREFEDKKNEAKLPTTDTYTLTDNVKKYLFAYHHKELWQAMNDRAKAQRRAENIHFFENCIQYLSADSQRTSSLWEQIYKKFNSTPSSYSDPDNTPINLPGDYLSIINSENPPDKAIVASMLLAAINNNYADIFITPNGHVGMPYIKFQNKNILLKDIFDKITSDQLNLLVAAESNKPAIKKIMEGIVNEVASAALASTPTLSSPSKAKESIVPTITHDDRKKGNKEKEEKENIVQRLLSLFGKSKKKQEEMRNAAAVAEAKKIHEKVAGPAAISQNNNVIQNLKDDIKAHDAAAKRARENYEESSKIYLKAKKAETPRHVFGNLGTEIANHLKSANSHTEAAITGFNKYIEAKHSEFERLRLEAIEALSNGTTSTVMEKLDSFSKNLAITTYNLNPSPLFSTAVEEIKNALKESSDIPAKTEAINKFAKLNKGKNYKEQLNKLNETYRGINSKAIADINRRKPTTSSFIPPNNTSPKVASSASSNAPDISQPKMKNADEKNLPPAAVTSPAPNISNSSPVVTNSTAHIISIGNRANAINAINNAYKTINANLTSIAELSNNPGKSSGKSIDLLQGISKDIIDGNLKIISDEYHHLINSFIREFQQLAHESQQAGTHITKIKASLTDISKELEAICDNNKGPFKTYLNPQLILGPALNTLLNSSFSATDIQKFIGEIPDPNININVIHQTILLRNGIEAQIKIASAAPPIPNRPTAAAPIINIPAETPPPSSAPAPPPPATKTTTGADPMTIPNDLRNLFQGLFKTANEVHIAAVELNKTLKTVREDVEKRSNAIIRGRDGRPI